MRIFPQRKSIRLKNYDYALPRHYYITVCTQNRKCLFGEIVGVGHDRPVQKMVLNNAGKTVENIWQSLPDRYPIELDVFQIMPNHVHFIIQIVGAGFMPARNERATTRVAPTTALGNIVGAFKSLTTREYINGVKNNGWKPFDKHLWQRNYWEHVVRNEPSLNKIRQYIKNNPQMWDRDRNNPKFFAK